MKLKEAIGSSAVHSMIKANAVMAIDQRGNNLKDSLDSGYDNVRDTLLEMKEREWLDASFPLYKEFAQEEARKLKIRLPIEYRKTKR